MDVWQLYSCSKRQVCYQTALHPDSVLYKCSGIKVLKKLWQEDNCHDAREVIAVVKRGL
jgi:hypothetical protein